MSTQIDHTARPEAVKHVLAEKFQLVRLAEPESLRAYPHAAELQSLARGHAQLRNEQRQEERVPQEVLRMYMR